MNFYTFSFICLISVLCSCNKKTETRLDAVPETVQILESISIKKGLCYGRCPAYTLMLTAEGEATYTCDRFCELDGEYTKTIDLSITSKIFKTAKDLDPMSFEDNYESNIPDMPLTTLGFNFKDSSKVIKGKLERPAALKSYEKLLIEIATDTTGWTETAQSKTKNADKHRRANTNQYIIKLKEGISLENWISSKSEYGVKKLAVHDAKNELWLISFDQKKTTPEDFKYMIEKDASISIAKAHSPKNR